MQSAEIRMLSGLLSNRMLCKMFCAIILKNLDTLLIRNGMLGTLLGKMSYSRMPCRLLIGMTCVRFDMGMLHRVLSSILCAILIRMLCARLDIEMFRGILTRQTFSAMLL